jgi:predicted NAD-dependent protein-ADP-ribosyltransferase YbiA (DUF1768 family)
MAEVQPPKFVEEAVAEVKPRIETPPEVPYTKEQKEDIESFFVGMTGRYRNRYKIGANGQLQVFSKENTLLKTLQLKQFRPITTEERAAMEENRKEQLATLDTLFEKKKQELREAILNYKATGAIEPVLQANQEVEDVELKRVFVRTPIRMITKVDVPEAREVLFDQPYETRKLFGNQNTFATQKDVKGNIIWEDPLSDGIFRLERRPFYLTNFYGRYEDRETTVTAEQTAVVEETGAGRVRLATGTIARIFDESDDEHNGFLSPGWPVEFIFKDTKYSSAFQAYEAERMRENNEDRVRTALLKTRSVRTIRTLTRKVTQTAKNPRKLWTEILTALYAQHPDLAKRLDSTGTDALIYADPVGGVGLARDDKKILDPKQWTQENIVGNVLELIRARLREKAPGSSVAPAGGALESVISEEEQKKARVGAIINARRRF